LTKAFKGKRKNGLSEAIDLAVLEFDTVEEIKPLLRIVFNSCDNVDQVLTGKVNVLDDYSKIA